MLNPARPGLSIATARRGRLLVLAGVASGGPITAGAAILVASRSSVMASTCSSAASIPAMSSRVFGGHGFGGVDPDGDLDPEDLLWSVISTRRPVLSRGPR